MCVSAPEGGANIVKDIPYLMIRLLDCMLAQLVDKTREESVDKSLGIGDPDMDWVEQRD